MKNDSRLLVALAAGALLASGCAASRKTAKKNEITAAPVDTYTGPKHRVGVVDFENKTAYGQRLGSAASDILITELVKSGKFIVIERDKLDKLMEEQKLDMSGAIDPKTAAQVGKIMGLNAIVTGSVSQFGVSQVGSDYLITQTKKEVADCTVDVRVVDVQTGQVLYADSGEGESTSSRAEFLGMGTTGNYDEQIEGESLRAALAKLVDNIVVQVDKTPWYAKVLDQEGPDFFIAAGTQSGIKPGQQLAVYHRGREIRDDNDIVVGYVEDKLGTATVDHNAGDSMSVCVMTNGQMPQKNDIVRLPDSN